MNTLLALLITFIVVALVCGLLYALVMRAPFIPADMKAIVAWAILAIGVVYFLMVAFGGASPPLRIG